VDVLEGLSFVGGFGFGDSRGGRGGCRVRGGGGCAGSDVEEGVSRVLAVSNLEGLIALYRFEVVESLP
jgi:hypothetical protein